MIIDNELEKIIKNKKVAIVGPSEHIVYELGDNHGNYIDSFDIVISINTVHNLALNECIQAIKEIERVAKQDSFITVDAYRNEEEKKRMNAWNLTAKTIMSVDEWKKLFEEIDYTGDYYWFIP